jgi:hypothetical protein
MCMGSFLKKISVILLSFFHLRKSRNIIVQVKCRKTCVPLNHLHLQLKLLALQYCFQVNYY